MAKVTGKGPIYIGATAVLHMGSWSIDGANAVEEFVDLVDNSKSADYGVQSYSGTGSGVNALADTTGQDLIRAAFTDKTKMTDIKFYEVFTDVTGEKAVYWTPKTGSLGLVITSIKSGKDGGSETSKFSFDFTCDGLMEYKVETIS